MENQGNIFIHIQHLSGLVLQGCLTICRADLFMWSPLTINVRVFGTSRQI